MEPREACYFRALYKAVVATNSSLDPQQVLGSLVQETASALGARGCSIMLLSPDRKELRRTVDYSLSEKYVEKGPVRVDLSMTEALEGKSVAVRDAVSDPRVQYGLQNRDEGIESILSVPIRLRERIIGVMRLYMDRPASFETREIELMEAVAHLGAVALDNARSHEELKSNYDMLSRYIYNDTYVGQIWSSGPRD